MQLAERPHGRVSSHRKESAWLCAGSPILQILPLASLSQWQTTALSANGSHSPQPMDPKVAGPQPLSQTTAQIQRSCLNLHLEWVWQTFPPAALRMQNCSAVNKEEVCLSASKISSSGPHSKLLSLAEGCPCLPVCMCFLEPFSIFSASAFF